jgi:hypothetical protein
MMLLICHGHPTLVRYRDDAHLGRLVQPRSFGSVALTATAGIPWAADNDAYNGWSEEAALRYVRMLDALHALPGCLFVTLPDVVGDARKTAERFSVWLPALVERSLPVALVAQDGIDELGVPWGKIDALFIGGTNDFKLGPVARDLVAEAKTRGKWVHMGRVNSLRRISYAAEIGCDSLDGTKYSMFPDTYIAQGIGDMKTAKLGAQKSMGQLLAESALRS